jgi:hypothetical protein
MSLPSPSYPFSQRTPGGQSPGGLSTDSAKENYARLLEKRDEIEAELRRAGVIEEIHWYNLDNAQLCRIHVRKTADVSDRDDWVGQQEWLLRRAEAFLAVFSPIVKSL